MIIIYQNGTIHPVSPESRISSAIRRNSIRGVKFQIMKGEPVDGVQNNVQNNTPLCISAHLNRVTCMQLLLSSGANPNIMGDGVSPLSIAADRGFTKCVYLLLQSGADPNLRSTDSLTPIMLAAENGHIDIVSLLHSWGADLTICRKSDQASPLILAANNGHIECVSFFLSNGVSPNQSMDDGGTALHFAAFNNNLNVVLLLLSNKANPCATMKSLWNLTTPLQIAEQYGNEQMVSAISNAIINWNNVSNQVAFKLCMSYMMRSGKANELIGREINSLSREEFVFYFIDELTHREMIPMAEDIISYIPFYVPDQISYLENICGGSDNFFYNICYFVYKLVAG